MPVETPCINGDVVAGKLCKVSATIAKYMNSIPLKDMEYCDNGVVTAKVDFSQMTPLQELVFRNRNITLFSSTKIDLSSCSK